MSFFFIFFFLLSQYEGMQNTLSLRNELSSDSRSANFLLWGLEPPEITEINSVYKILSLRYFVMVTHVD